MLISETPGATMHFAFHGTTVGLFVAAGPDAGTVEYSVDGGPFREQNLYTAWSKDLHIPWTYVLDGDLSDADHQVALRVSQTKDQRSTGHAARIVDLLVN